MLKEMVLRAKHIIFGGKNKNISVNYGADNLLSRLSPLISVAASNFPLICDVIRAVRPMTVY